jgi:hypothetical protein
MNYTNSSSRQTNVENCWRCFASDLATKLDNADDPQLWQVAIEQICADTMPSIMEYRGKECVLIDIGRCSHWIRPHSQDRVGTRLPSGYNKTVSGFSFRSLPAFDWSLKWQFTFDEHQWIPATGQPSRRPLLHRIAIPARTALHPQATVHAIWTPGSPTSVSNKLEAVYAFERTNNSWRCFAMREIDR